VSPLFILETLIDSTWMCIVRSIPDCCCRWIPICTPSLYTSNHEINNHQMHLLTYHSIVIWHCS
jgi:hypothetical protein